MGRGKCLHVWLAAGAEVSRRGHRAFWEGPLRRSQGGARGARAGPARDARGGVRSGGSPENHKNMSKNEQK